MIERKIEKLIHLIAENEDQLAFNELYKYYFPGLFSFAHSILKNKENSEEVILDIFLKLWESRKTISKIQNISAYLYTAVKYASISFLRKQKIVHWDELRDDMLYSFVSPESGLISKENIAALTTAVNGLPPRCRLIFRLIKEENFRYEEVSQLLNISIKTVEAQMYIATKKLLTALQNSMPEFIHLKKISK